MTDEHYLKLLAKKYPDAEAAASEIINLRAIMSLPKGTEYFFSDLHGEHAAFLFQLKSASGVVRKKIDELFEQSISEEERTALAKLIYYPEPELARAARRESGFDDWCRITIYRLVEVCKEAASKYTRSKVRKKLPEHFAYIIDELLHADGGKNKPHYYSEIIKSIVQTGMSVEFITALCNLIQQLLIDRLHIIGDIYDRGPRPDSILDALGDFRDIDIQWGNHDISWMGAASGNRALMANVVRLGISYNTFDLLEDGYGINLRPLSAFAERVYRDDPCEYFTPHILDENLYDPVDLPLAAKMHKAIAVIQFKLEGQLIEKHPEYKMSSRLLLKQIDFENGIIHLDGTVYPLRDKSFPTVDPKNPLELTKEEKELMKAITYSFRHSERLQKHIRFLYSHGSMYLRMNSNLLYHGCIPMTQDGEFDTVGLGGRKRKGRELLEYLDSVVREAYFAPDGTPERENAQDMMWYLWCGVKSPLFGKSKMSTFERYFIEAPATHEEKMNPYYHFIEQREPCEKILREFGLDPADSHIINGHVPVKLKQGENPVKGGGRLFMIDGGISKSYQKQTGIGGYTFIANSRYLALAEHQPLKPGTLYGEDSPKVMVVEAIKQRVTVADTDTGVELNSQIQELSALLQSYRNGVIKENT
ncbi:fructose-1,6-bisphosphatase [Caproicibacter fermentans]|uniref:Fructose-1,6-bisphosphatase class 3 n=1 Tax=Caproicibacter fermentans TaxID=2576756 RepID=A0A7G8TBS0_9FIRM|nr:fructose-1,6-bisphosphatase [Caproicibacter fermentans]QNK41061.1 fructose-1,6-bisphosphatase [Caproicibacter fermentans]